MMMTNMFEPMKGILKNVARVSGDVCPISEDN